MLNQTRNPEKQALSDKLKADTQAFLDKGGEIKQHQIYTNLSDVPSDQFTKMRREAEACKDRMRPTKFNRSGKL